MKKMKKQLAVAVTVALLTLPLSASMVLAETGNPSTTIVTTTEEISDDTILDTTVTDEAVVDEIVTEETTTEETTTEETTTDETAPVTDEDGKDVAPSNWLSNLIGKLQLALTFDPVRKGQLNERHALAKLAEAQKLMTEGKAEASEKALNKYTEKIALAQEFLDQVGDTESEEAQKLTIALTNVNTNNIKVLGNLLEKLPPQAAQRVALNVVRSMERAVNKAEKQEAEDATAIPSETALEATLETVPATITPATESVTTPASAAKAKALARDISMEKRAKVALKDFKKTLQEKHIIEPEDEKQSVEENEVVGASENDQPTLVTVAPAQLQKAPASVQALVQEKREQVKPGSQGNDKSGDKSNRGKSE